MMKEKKKSANSRLKYKGKYWRINVYFFQIKHPMYEEENRNKKKKSTFILQKKKKK